MRSCYILRLWIIAAWAVIPVLSSARGEFIERGRDETIRIGSYNVENLWDGSSENTPKTWQNFLNSLSPTERRHYPRQLQYLDYDPLHSNWLNRDILAAKVQSVVQVIELMGQPDILALQEIESAGNESQIFALPYNASQTFREKLEEMGYVSFLVGAQEVDNPVAVTTAVIAKMPLHALPSVKIRGGSTSARDIQVVEALIGNGRLLVFNGHWKSKRGGGEEARTATARLVRERIRTERTSKPSTDVIAVGDFNASYYERPLLALGSTGDERKMLGEPTSELYNLWFELARSSRWENSFNGTRGTLSHMLVSDSLYDQRGLQYIDQSFRVVGQAGAEAKLLLGAGGTPYRWQTRRSGKNSTEHLGRGFSDHLPLVAAFRVKNAAPESGSPDEKIEIETPRSDDKSDDLEEIIFDEVDVCTREESQALAEIHGDDLARWEGRCVYVDIPESEDALLLKVRGVYSSSYIDLPWDSASDKSLINATLGLTMTRGYDSRPNIDDSRVSRADAAILAGAYNPRSFHPHSNKCFQRKVLQGRGGRLRRAMGRLGFNDGYLALHIATREEKDIILEDLPHAKVNACPWY